MTGRRMGRAAPRAASERRPCPVSRHRRSGTLSTRRRRGEPVRLRGITPVRVSLGFAIIATLGPVSCCLLCPASGTYFEWKYRYRIHEGMTLSEVEGVLGQGTQSMSPRGPRDEPVVACDEFYIWSDNN